MLKPLQPPIGVFDSGVGGLSILRELRSLLPGTSFIYVADQAHVPYGSRLREEIRDFSFGITRFLLDQGAEIIVVACNTASAAALHELRTAFPNTPFIGMEPAVKPAAESTRSGVVGVLATPATFQGDLYTSVVERFAQGVKLIPHTCPGLVKQIESGELESEETIRILEEALQPMLALGVDTIVLGCTHYPFIIPIIQKLVNQKIRVIDPAPAIARQTVRVLEKHPAYYSYAQPTGSLKMEVRYYTSDDTAKLKKIISRLIGENAAVEPLCWEGTIIRPCLQHQADQLDVDQASQQLD